MTDATLRAELEAAVLAEMERRGPEAFQARIVVEQFVGRGLSRATAYRWVRSLVEAGRAGAHLAAAVRSASASATDVADTLPHPIAADDIVAAGGLVRIASELRTCLDLGQQIIRQSKSSDGTVRPMRTPLVKDREAYYLPPSLADLSAWKTADRASVPRGSGWP